MLNYYIIILQSKLKLQSQNHVIFHTGILTEYGLCREYEHRNFLSRNAELSAGTTKKLVNNFVYYHTKKYF